MDDNTPPCFDGRFGFRNGEPTWFFLVEAPKASRQFLGLERISPDHLGMVRFFLEMNEAMIMNHEAMRHPKYVFLGFIPETYQIWRFVSWFIQQTVIFVQLTWHFDQQIKRGMGQNHEENL